MMDSDDTYIDNRTIWNMWWNEDFSMDPIVSMAYKSIEKNSPQDSQRITLNKNNLKEYIDLPEVILEKINDGRLPLSNMVDVVRLALLSKYGGYWSEISLFATGDFGYVFDYELYTIKHDYGNPQSIADNKWSLYSIGGYNTKIFKALYFLMSYYWVRVDINIDYFIADYTFKWMYNNFLDFKNIIDNVTCTNGHVSSLQANLNNVYDYNLFRDITSDTTLFKLSRKISVSKKINGQESFYGHLRKEYF